MVHANDQQTINFGKHRGHSFFDVASKHPKYCEWALEQPNPGGGLQEFRKYLLESGQAATIQNAPKENTSSRQTKQPKKKTEHPMFANMTTPRPLNAQHFALDLQMSQHGWTSANTSGENADPNDGQGWANSSATPSFSSTNTGDAHLGMSKFEQWRTPVASETRFPGQPIGVNAYSGQSFAESGIQNCFSALEEPHAAHATGMGTLQAATGMGTLQGAHTHSTQALQYQLQLNACAQPNAAQCNQYQQDQRGQYHQLDPQGGPFPQQDQGGPFPQQDQGGQYLQQDQGGQYLQHDQGGQYAQQPYPQCGQYPQQDLCGQYPQQPYPQRDQHMQPDQSQQSQREQFHPQLAQNNMYQQLYAQDAQQNQHAPSPLQRTQSFRPGAQPQPTIESLDQFAFNPTVQQVTHPTKAPVQQVTHPTKAPVQQVTHPTKAPEPCAPTPSAPSKPVQLDLRNCTLSVEPYDKNVFRVVSSTTLPQEVFAKISHLHGANKSTGGWSFPVSEYKEVVQFLRKNPDFLVQVQESPKWVLQCIPVYQDQVPKPKTKCSILDKDGEKDFPGRNMAEFFAGKRSYGEDKALMPYQIEAVMFGIRNGGRALIGDEMGLGKTVEALTLASAYIDEWPCLVVVPSSVRFMWRDEALEWVNLTPEEITVVKSGKQEIKPTSRFVIVSYDMLARNESFHVRADGHPYGVVVLDECHYIKNRESQRARAAIKIAHSSKRAILLSGTPSLNQAAEMYTQFYALMPHSCPTFKEFADRFCEKMEMWFNGKGKGKGRPTIQYRGSKRGSELNVMLTTTIMIRRLKSEVLKQLPTKRRQKVKLETKERDLKELKSMMAANGIHSDMADFMDCVPEVGNSLSELFQATTRAKLPAVHEYVEYLVNVGCKFIIFAHHHFCIDEIEAKVKNLKVDYIRIDGRVTGQERENRVKRFNEGGMNVPVAILSITACGQGLNLQSCSTVVFAEMYWVPGQLIQAEDRVHRLGQQASSVNIHYLTVPDSIDDIMYNTLCKKHRDLTVMLDGEEKSLTAANVANMGAVEIQRQKTVAAQSSRPTEPVFGFPSDIVDVESESSLLDAKNLPTRQKRKSLAPETDHDPKQRRIDSFFKRKTKNSSSAQFDSKKFF